MEPLAFEITKAGLLCFGFWCLAAGFAVGWLAAFNTREAKRIENLEAAARAARTLLNTLDAPGMPEYQIYPGKGYREAYESLKSQLRGKNG